MDAAETEKDTDQATVRTSAPQYQKDEWVEHADELDMSLSEFVRSMVQAGRRGFEAPAGERDANGTEGAMDDLRGRLLDALADAEYLSWEELVDEIVDDIEADVETELQALLDENRVEHSPRNGGYRLVE